MPYWEAMRRRSACVLCLCLLLTQAAAWPSAQSRPRIVVLATGGTIAGAAPTDTQASYASGQLGVDRLIAAVPQAAKIADLAGEQIANVGSQNMSDAIWLTLARRINTLLAAPDVNGIVITHGTDTIEETAYFLNLVVKFRKPVVMTAAMRPATSLSADGPLNFYNAVAVAVSADAAGRGVLVVMDDAIHGAATVTKTSTTSVDAFVSPVHGLIGQVVYGQAHFDRAPHRRHTTESEFSIDGVDRLPRVDILYAHADMPGDLIDAAVAAGAKGLVVAGVGNGNVTEAALRALARAARQGVVCVRSTRVATGLVSRNVEVDDDGLGLVASDEVTAPKARVLLKLALLAPRTAADVQRIFMTY